MQYKFSILANEQVEWKVAEDRYYKPYKNNQHLAC